MRAVIARATFALVLCLSTQTVSGPRTVEVYRPPAEAVASAHPIATQAGLDVLAAGGNAFDAAVGRGGDAGGGRTLWLRHRWRRLLPAAPQWRRSERHDRRPRDRTRRPPPAICIWMPTASRWRICRATGRWRRAFPVSRPRSITSPSPSVCAASRKIWRRRSGRHAKAFRSMKSWRVASPLRRTASHRPPRPCFCPGGMLPSVGRPAQAGGSGRRPSSRSRARAAKAFMKDPWRRSCSRAPIANGGIWSLEDLADYRIKEREPTTIQYRGYEITTASLPSAGGVTLSQVFNILEARDWPPAGDTAARHELIEAMRLAYRDRAIYLGDADFVDVPVERLTSEAYAPGTGQTHRPQGAGQR